MVATPRSSFMMIHLLMIGLTVAQLLLIIMFLVLLLGALDGTHGFSWAAVFAPLWVSDAISLATLTHDIVRLTLPRGSEPVRRNLLISQLNRFKGTLCIAIFKLLVVHRLSDAHDPTPARVIAIPFFVCAVGRLVLHYFKERVPGPEPSSPPKRPGTPVNPLHLFVLLVAFRIDGLTNMSWAATLWPTWLLFALLGVAMLVAGLLGLGIALTGESHENGQRALVFICYSVLATIGVNGFVFQLNLVRRLDNLSEVSNAAIMAPLIAAYCGVLAFYLAFSFVLPRYVDADLSALAARSDGEEHGRDGVLEAISQQLAPPFLVQQSSTLFARVNSTMLYAFLAEPHAAARTVVVALGPAVAGAPAASGARCDGDGDVDGDADLDLERGGGWCADVDGAGSDRVRQLGGSTDATLAAADAAAAADACWAADPMPVLSEYESLHRELASWLRKQEPLSRRAAIALASLEPRVRPAAPEEGAAADGDDDGVAIDASQSAEHDPATEPLAAHARAPAVDDGSLEGGLELVSARSEPTDPPLPLARTSSGGHVFDLTALDFHAPGAQPPPPPPPPPSLRAAGRAHARPVIWRRRRAVGGASVEPAAARKATDVPAEILAKLHRFVDLKRQIASRLASATLAETARLGATAAERQAIGSGDDGPAAERSGARARSSSISAATVEDDVPPAAAAGLPRTPATAAAAVAAVAAHRESEAGARGDDDVDVDDDEAEESFCWICCEGPRDAVLLECGHGGVCLACARRCFNKAGRLCPMCRTPIEQVVHIQLPADRAAARAPRRLDGVFRGALIVRVHESDAQQQTLLGLSGQTPPAVAAAEAGGTVADVPARERARRARPAAES